MKARRFFLAAGALLAREMARFVRQRSRLVGALATPLMFWFFLGAGLGDSFRVPGGAAGPGLNYLQYFIPGAMVLVCLFTAIFSTFSVIEDRQAGFLQAVLVSPAPRGAIVFGALAGGTLLAFFQAALFMALLPIVHVPLTPGGVAIASAMLLLLSFGLTGLGFFLAWRTDSSAAFHALTNLILLPIWFLSGAVFPLSGAPSWLRGIMGLNPATYAVAALHQGFFRGEAGISLATCFLVNILFAGAMFLLSWRTVVRRNPG
jgi:ABC-2 type transport system permease protein